MSSDSSSARSAPDEPSQDEETGVDVPAPHDAVGAYVLDALPQDERRAFEAHLQGCAECRRAVTELAPVVGVLPRRYDLDPLPAGAVVMAPPEPSPDLRRRIVAAARAEGERGAPSARVAPTVVRPPVAWWSHGGWAAAAVLAVVAAGAIVWALTLQQRLDQGGATISAQATAIAAQEAELAQLRQSTNAELFALAPTSDGPSDATGSLLYALHDQFGVLYVRGLAPLPPGRVYQLWYLKGGTPQPGGTFEVDSQGVGSLALTQNVQDVDAVALTAEPSGGSQAPTSAPLLAGAITPSAG